MKAFITGSRAYGTPREDSDTDLVVLLSPWDMGVLFEQSGDEPPDYSTNTACIRFGKLNLLCCTDQDDFAVWRAGTDALIARRPVTRDEAVAEFSARRQALENERAAAMERELREAEPPPDTLLALCPECAAYGMACSDCDERGCS